MPDSLFSDSLLPKPLRVELAEIVFQMGDRSLSAKTSFVSAMGMCDIMTCNRVRESRNATRLSQQQKRQRQPGRRGRPPKRQRQDEESDHDHDDACYACGGGGEVLLCDHCERVYHLRCLSPPLEKVPEGEWLCPVCLPADPELPPFDPTPFEDEFWRHQLQAHNEMLRLTGRKAELLNVVEPLAEQRRRLREQAIEQTRLVTFAQAENKQLRAQLQQLDTFIRTLSETVNLAAAALQPPP